MRNTYRFVLAWGIGCLFAALAGCESDDLRSSGAPADPFTVTFPATFLWGSAGSAYQSEGSFRPGGGRAESNWTRWEDRGGIPSGDTNEQGSGFYLKYDSDFALAQADGHNAIRIEIPWYRIEPEPGVYDAVEMQHYLDVVDAARARGLNPVITLYHWVVPTWVADPIADTDQFRIPLNEALWERYDGFVRYVVSRIGDRVDYYVTFNEPFSVISAGYLAAMHPPGKVFDIQGATDYVVNVLFMHARAYRSIRELDTVDADGDGRATMIGLAHVANPFYPKDPNNPGDVRGAETLSYIVNLIMNNALVYGDVDITLDGDIDDQDTVPPEGNYPELAGTQDFLGINYYGPLRVTEFIPPIYGFPLLGVDDYDPLLPHNGLNREINAADFRATLDLYAHYDLPFLITENGTDTQEFEQRAQYTMEHVYVLGEAMKDGLTVLGYLHWSLTDNFEWTEGYAPRFGLYQVDYDTPALPRIPSNGVSALRDIIAAGRIDRALYDQYAGGKYPSDGRP